jgi:hypothetical protein
MAGLPGVNIALPAKAAQTLSVGLVRGTSAVVTSLVTSGFFIGLCAAAYYLVRKFISSYRHAHLLNQVGTNSLDGLAIGYAQRLYASMISGHVWWNDWFGDGTDEDAMYKVAQEMYQHKVPFPLVSAKFKVLFNRELLDDIQDELNADEQAKFQTALSTGALSGLGSPALLTGQLLVTTSTTPVFDSQLRAVQEVPPLVRLGPHVETLYGPTGQVWLGFPFGQQMRFVSALAVTS